MVSFLALNGAALAASFIVALALGRDGRGSLLVLRVLCGYLVIVHSVTLAAGLLGHLTVKGLAVLVTVALGAALWLAAVVGSRARTGVSPQWPGGGVPATTLFPLLAAIAAGITWAWPHLFHATRLWIWDDYTYHLVYPALWITERAIAAAAPAQAFTMQAWYPLSADLVSTWFMAPFPGSRGDALAWVSLAGPLYAGIALGGAAELLARAGCRHGAWAVPAALLFTSRRIDVMASSFSDADLAQAALLFAALAFAVPPDGAAEDLDLAADAWYAGLLTGLAVGVKVSAAPLAVMIMVVVARRAGVRLAARIAPVFVLCWLATAGYWYVRNVVHTGNPIYPAKFLGRPGTTFPETTLLEYGRHYGFRRALADALEVYLNWPRGHAIVAVIGLVGLGVLALLRWRSLSRGQRYLACGTIAMVATTLLLLPFAPYSAGNAMTFRSGFVHWDSMRYVALLPILGWVAVGLLADVGLGSRAWATLAGSLIATVALLTSGNPVLASPVLLLATAFGAAVLAATRVPAARWVPRTARAGAVWTVAGALVLAGIVAGWHGAKAEATAASIHRERLFGAVAAMLDRQPAGARVAVFGDQWIYPTFGARHHLVPLRLDQDGRLASAPIGDAMEPGDLTVDAQTFAANLRASRIDVVVVVHLAHPGRSPEWPTQQSALEQIPGAQLLHRDSMVAMWKVSP